MPGQSGSPWLQQAGAAVLVLAALFWARSIMAPVACALVIIAVVWPLKSALGRAMPNTLAVLLTMVATVVTVASVAALAVWGFGRVGQWAIDNGAQLQALYARQTEWLGAQGFGPVDAAAAQFDMRSILIMAQQVSGALRDLLSFTGLALLFTLLGLLEVDTLRDRLAAQPPGGAAGATLRATGETARKLQTYMLVRSLMSLLTGIGVFVFARATGLELAAEWGVIAFALNYIPFLGPLVATVLPTALAGLQFDSWDMAIAVFVGMNVIQLAIGSYLEPRMTGALLAVSAFAVLFAVFLWTLIWGVAGAFLGTPILIALLTLCEQDPRTRWLPDLVSMKPAEPAGAEAPGRQSR